MSLKPIPPRPGIPGDEERYKRDLEDMRRRPAAWGAKAQEAPITEVGCGYVAVPSSQFWLKPPPGTVIPSVVEVSPEVKLSPGDEDEGTSSLEPTPPAQPSKKPKRGRPRKKGV